MIKKKLPKRKPVYTYPCVVDLPPYIVEVKRYPPSWEFDPDERKGQFIQLKARQPAPENLLYSIFDDKEDE